MAAWSALFGAADKSVPYLEKGLEYGKTAFDYGKHYGESAFSNPWRSLAQAELVGKLAQGAYSGYKTLFGAESAQRYRDSYNPRTHKWRETYLRKFRHSRFRGRYRRNRRYSRFGKYRYY